MNSYQFNQIARQMEKKYGKVAKGQEERYLFLLFPMESNLLKVHRQSPNANSRKLLEAISLALFSVADAISGEKTDTSAFETKDNLLLKEALLYAFDPFTNEG